MYCKKCGRKLRSEARFCDHCGQSTKETGNTKTKSTGNTKTKSTTNSKTSAGRGQSTSARSEYERNKKRRELERQRVKRNRKLALFVILIALAASTVLGFATYNMMKPSPEEQNETKVILGDDTMQDEEAAEDASEDDELSESEPTEELEDENAEEEEKATPKPTKTPSSEKDGEEKEKEEKKDYTDISKECNIYKDDRMDEIGCPYPSDFVEGSRANANTVLSLVDPENDGSMMICAETVGTSKSAASLLNSYSDGLGKGTKVSQSDSGDGWYSISFSRNNKVNHRKAIIVDGLCVYYDFSCDIDSGNKEAYNDYMEYIDHYLQEELASSAKKKDK